MTTELRAQLQAALGAAYTVDRELGGGGMSRVFVATENTLGRKVVVKVLPPDLAAEVSAERFRREVQVAAQLQNAHIVPLLTAGEGEGLLYYTMPLVEGETLRARLARDGELPLGAAMQVLRDVAKALAYAHRNGVVHRDIKPENILISDGDAFVADFGVAKAIRASATHGDAGLTSVGMALGTPAYMAPEQAAGDATADARADLYALGAVAYEMLTGSPLFPGRSPQALLAAHTTETPEPIERRRPSLPPALAVLVMRLLEKRPADRPQSAEEVLRALDDATINGGTGLRTGYREPPPPGANRRRLAMAIALGSVILGAVVIAIVQSGRVAAPRAEAIEASVAVLPFVNMSGDKDNEYFSDGMTEELIDRLANLHGIRVAARTSSFAFKGKDENVSEIGRQLHVRNVVEGSVRRSGTHVRITAQLIDADSGYHRWSHTYDAEVKDVFAVQQQIGTAIAGALQLALAGRDSIRLARAPTADTGAHRLYLLGRFHWNQRSGPALEQAVVDFRGAIARDPQYADAYAALAQTYTILPFYADVAADSVYALAEESGRRALALDSTNAKAWAAIANAHEGRYDFEKGDKAFRRAIELDPADPDARHWMATWLATVGRFREATEQARLAADLDPLSIAAHEDLAEVLLEAGDLAGAESAARRARDIDPLNPSAHISLAGVLCAQGRYDSAIALTRAALALEGADPYLGDLASLAYFYGKRGERDSALAIRAGLERRARKERVNPGTFAMIALGLGEKDRAFDYLRQALDAHEGYITNLFPNDPVFASLRSDPRFDELKRRIHLPT